MHYTISANLRKHRRIFVSFAIACLAVTILLAVNALSVARSESVIVTYPLLKSAQPSNTYSVTVNGQPVFVEKYNSLSYIHFAFAGKANIEIAIKENVKNYTLSPKRYKLSSSTNTNKIYFSLTVPRKIILHQVNLLKENLFIIADSLEDISPKVGDMNVTNIMNFGVDNTGQQDSTTNIQKAIDEVSGRFGILYFPPGVYKIKQLNLKSNMTLYLAGGSVLEATKEINPSYGRGLLYIKDVNNVKIMGRGVVYGNGSYWRSHGGWYSLIQGENANNVILQDIILRDPCVANVWMSHLENWKIYNVKILADPINFINTDGFDFWSSRNITIDNVLYKGTDDATSHGGDKKGIIQNNENINVINSVFYGGSGFKIGTTAEQEIIHNITYENIDVVYADSLAGLWPVTAAKFDNIYFKNIRSEDIMDAPKGSGSADLFQWRIMVASWEPTSSPNNLGYIRNVYVSNLTADDHGGKNSIFQGYDSQHDIRNVTFDNLYVEGKLALNPKDAYFDIANQYVDLKFTTSNPKIVNITAKNLYASQSGDAGQFRITRTGDTSQALTVKYTIRGTAKNGTDYQTIPDTVTIPIGGAEATITIQSQDNTKQEELKTVFLSLENLPNSTDYMLGPDFHAVVNIRN
jgi:polygalacturonase